MYKKTILIDLDGVLNTYTGDFDKKYIPPIKDGAYNFLEKLAAKFDIKIFTTRNKLLTIKWVFENGIDKFVGEVTNIKEPAWMIIDDRCINFQGSYDKIFDEIENFKVWYK
jgi:hypothetical protein